MFVPLGQCRCRFNTNLKLLVFNADGRCLCFHDPPSFLSLLISRSAGSVASVVDKFYLPEIAFKIEIVTKSYHGP